MGQKRQRLFFLAGSKGLVPDPLPQVLVRFCMLLMKRGLTRVYDEII